MFFPEVIKQKIYRKENTPGKEPASGEDISGYLPERKCRKGSMTLETALVLPWFLFAMLALLQFAQITNISTALLYGAHDTVKDMAVYAYVKELGVGSGAGTGEKILAGGLSAAYAGNEIRKKSEVGSDLCSLSLLQSSFMKNDVLDLVLTFKPKHTYTILPVKKQNSIVRARVRAWTGREGSNLSGEGEEGEADQQKTVYVAETGTVYHTDPNCTHINLSIQPVAKKNLAGVRNVSGEKYHVCEKCGAGSGDMVYISPYGNKYHSSLECSGLKRTVHEVTVTEIGNLKPCSKCSHD